MNHTAFTRNNTDNTTLIHGIVDASIKCVWTALILIGIIIILGISGNVMVILAVKHVKKLQTVSNVFIVNLSICDLLSVGCVLPFNIYTYIADGWYLAPVLCEFVGFIGYTLTGTTIITITLIAYNRYKLVLDPSVYKQLYTRRNILIMLLVTWTVPAVCLTPAVVGMFGKFGYVPMLVTCNLLLHHESQMFKIVLMVLRAGLPSGLIVYFYARIYQVTTTSHQRLNRNCRQLSALDIHNHQQEMHMTRMMLIIFLVFIISYFPCTITGLIDWNKVLSKEFHMFCQISIYLGSAINPLVYGLMNPQFRQAYREFMCCSKQRYTSCNISSIHDFKSSVFETNKSTVKLLPWKQSDMCSLEKYANLEKPSTDKTDIYNNSLTEHSSDTHQLWFEMQSCNEIRPRFTLE